MPLLYPLFSLTRLQTWDNRITTFFLCADNNWMTRGVRNSRRRAPSTTKKRIPIKEQTQGRCDVGTEGSRLTDSR